MAGPFIPPALFLTYLTLLPSIISFLFDLIIQATGGYDPVPDSPNRYIRRLILRRKTHCSCRKFTKTKRSPPVNHNINENIGTQDFFPDTHLFVLPFIIFWLGCRIEMMTRLVHRQLSQLRSFPLLTRIVAFSASDKLSSRGVNVLQTRFDTDSFKIGVDCHASRTMSPVRSAFRDLRPFKASVGGIGSSSVTVESIGTFQFSMEDDDGHFHRIEIPNSLLVPNLA